MMFFYSQSNSTETPDTTLGKLKTKEELDKYERLWDRKVFVPAMQELDEKVLLKFIDELMSIIVHLFLFSLICTLFYGQTNYSRIFSQCHVNVL